MASALVVDDNRDIRLLLRMLLRSGGFDVAEASSGVEALRMLDAAGAGVGAEALPDVVLLDVQMPVLDGWDTLVEIRRSPEVAAVPVVMCTVRSSPEDRRRAWELGCDGYLVKPFQVEDVVPEVRAAASRAAGERSEYRREQIEDAMAELAGERRL